MSSDLPFGCTCGCITGSVRGVTQRNARRLSCLCDDCQTYAQFLGRGAEILDVFGGTDLSYATPSQVRLEHGHEQLACVRLRAKGLLRWYARCCNTPLLHTTSSPRIAFVGIPHLALHPADAAPRRDRDLGPLRVRLQARFAKAAPPPGAHEGVPFARLAASRARILWDSLCLRHAPSPVFDPAGDPIALPLVLS